MRAFFHTTARVLIYPIIYMAVQLFVTLLVAIVSGVSYLMQHADLSAPAQTLVNEAADYMIGFSAANIQLTLILSAVLTLGIVYFIFRKTHRDFFAAMALTPVRAYDSLLLVISGITLNLTCKLLLTVIEMPRTVVDAYEQSPVVTMLSGEMTLNILCLVVFVPIVEEVVFRGCAYNRLRAAMGFFPALVLQTALFAVMHFNSLQTLYVLLAGAVLGLSYLWSKSLLGSVLLHSAYNCTTLILMLVPEGTQYQTALTALLIASPLLLIACLLLLERSCVKNPAAPVPKG